MMPRKCKWYWAILPATALSGCAHVPAPHVSAHIDWVLDPDAPGPDLPPSGRSLFDALVPSPPPFPFSKLLEAIESQPEKVLIPLSRSLQRNAGAPDFFKYPRAVVAFDTSIGDRLFMGYHEKAGVIEVISYNDQAGRFEFQLVKNYRQGATASVLYASRKTCTGCHQNQAPLFPKQLWDETNANPAVSRLLLAEGREYYGFPVEETADTPYRIDLSVHRANYFSAWQLLWASALPQQRAALFEAALRCRLRQSCAPGEELQPLIDDWRKRWPHGLAIPNPEIPNRSPLAVLSREGPADYAATMAFVAHRQMTIEPVFEPANRRAPLDVWHGEPRELEQFVMGLASLFPQYDVEVFERVRKQRPRGALPPLATVSAGVFRPSAILQEAVAALSTPDRGR